MAIASSDPWLYQTFIIITVTSTLKMLMSEIRKTTAAFLDKLQLNTKR